MQEILDKDKKLPLGKLKIWTGLSGFIIPPELQDRRHLGVDFFFGNIEHKKGEPTLIGSPFLKRFFLFWLCS